MNTATFFIYARKSTDEASRQVRSIDDQIAELREMARRDGLSVTRVFVEKQTAKVPGRPVFNDMLSHIERGEASGILAWHPDRLARNSIDGGKIIYLVDTGAIADLKFPTFVFDPSPSGKFMLSIMFGQSKYYVDNLSENIRRGHRQKVQGGVWPGWAPVGYLNDRATRTIVPDPQRGPLIRKAFELYATGNYTLDRLTQAVTDLGLICRHGQPLSRAQFHRLLSNPIYYGVFRYKGEAYEGSHEPLVAKTLFDKVQEVMCRKSKPKTPALKPYRYRGMFRCGECGAFITTETQKGHNYLHCTKRVKRDCSQPYVREERVMEEITAELRRFALPAEWADDMVVELEQERDGDTGARQTVTRSLQGRVRDIDAKSERLMEAYLAQAMTLAEYRTAKEKLVGEKQGLKQQIAVAETTAGGWFEPAIRFVSDAKQAGIIAESGEDDERRDFLKEIGSNLTITNRHLSVIPRNAWKLVVDQGHFAHHNAAPLCRDAASVGETDPYLIKRRGGDSNSRDGLSRLQHFQCCSFSHSDTSPGREV
jgi:site-specific DNA recombinase